MNMNSLFEIQSTLQTILPPSIPDIIDIAVLSFIIYKLIQFLRNTRAEGLAKGILFFGLAYIAAFSCKLKALTFILEKAFNVGILALVILFQPELRRTLEKVGHYVPFLNQKADSAGWANAVNAICRACHDLSKLKSGEKTATGALIVIEGNDRLNDIIGTGTVLNAEPTAAVLKNIFNTGGDLHDGALVMRDGMIVAAGCILPLTNKNERVNKALGTRHRAALGMSENSDALVIVVSEETGRISIAENGKITRTTEEGLQNILERKYLPNTMMPGSIDISSAEDDSASIAGRQIIPDLISSLKKKNNK